MRILLVTHGYPPFEVTGVERLSEQAALGLTAAGHDVTVFSRRETTAPPAPKLERTSRRGVRVVMLSGGGAFQGRFPRFAPRVERLFERTVLDVEPQVVLISHLIGHSPGYVSIAHHWGASVVLELHDFYLACERAHLQRRSGELCRGPEGGRACATYCFPEDHQALERWALRTQMYRRTLEEADALICPSRFVAEYFRETFGPTMPRLHVIGNGVEARGDPATPSRSGARPLHLACVGVVTPHKGAHVVLEALRLARLPEARLTLFGVIRQPYFRDLLRNAEGIENLQFRAYGTYEPAELPFLLGDVDAVVIPSLVWETYSIVAREAMACGVPVIASRLGALPEAVRNEDNGLLFEPGSAHELAAILHMIDSDRERLNGLSAGIRRSDLISAEERTRRLQAVLHDVIADREPLTAAVPAQEGLSVLREALFTGPAATR